MFCSRTARIFLCTSRRLTGLALILCAGACANILYWITQWKRFGVKLCSMDVFLCLLQPSFLLMIFVPLCLLAGMADTPFFAAPHLCRFFQTRRQLAGQIFLETAIHTLLFTLVTLLCALFMAFVFFGSHLTIYWTQPQSRYWYDTGHVLQQTLSPSVFLFWQGLAICLAGIVFRLAFQIIFYLCHNAHRGSVLGWIFCLFVAWSISFPVTPMLLEWQHILTFSTLTIQRQTVGYYFICGVGVIFIECAALTIVILRRDFL